MEYWTILWVTILGGPLDGSVSYLIYPSLAECEASITEVMSTVTYDYNVMCEETVVASSSPRPIRNPIYGE